MQHWKIVSTKLTNRCKIHLHISVTDQHLICFQLKKKQKKDRYNFGVLLMQHFYKNENSSVIISATVVVNIVGVE